jgi:hypothetical protein
MEILLGTEALELAPVGCTDGVEELTHRASRLEDALREAQASQARGVRSLLAREGKPSTEG